MQGQTEPGQPNQNTRRNTAWISYIHTLKILAGKFNSWKRDFFASFCRWQLCFHNARPELLFMCALPLRGFLRCLSISHGKTPFPAARPPQRPAREALPPPTRPHGARRPRSPASGCRTANGRRAPPRGGGSGPRRCRETGGSGGVGGALRSLQRSLPLREPFCGAARGRVR